MRKNSAVVVASAGVRGDGEVMVKGHNSADLFSIGPIGNWIVLKIW